jgi:predicted regulator of Ras-like GTPase activity (Roadblock/LC7/MglB family)
VTAADALEELNEISSQISAAVLFGEDGRVEASTIGPSAAEELARAARALLVAATENGDVAQLEAAVAGGSVFVVREGARTIAATTGPEPTVGLVFYDLKSCLRTVTAGELEAAAKPKPKPKPRKPRAPRKKKEDGAGA